MPAENWPGQSTGLRFFGEVFGNDANYKGQDQTGPPDDPSPEQVADKPPSVAWRG